MDKRKKLAKKSESNENQPLKRAQVSEIADRQKLEHPESGKNEPKEKEKTPNDRASIVIAFLALIAASFAAFYTYRQSEIAKEAAQRQLRAYLTITESDRDFPLKVAFSVQTGKPVISQYTVKNVGQTPAYNFRSKGGLLWQDSVRQEDFDKLDTAGGFNTTVLNPGTEMNFPPTLPRPRDGNKSRIFLCGIARFTDAFDSNRYAQFCYEYMYIHQSFYPYEKFNNAN